MSSRRPGEIKDRRLNNSGDHLTPKNVRGGKQPHASGRSRTRSNAGDERHRDSPTSTLDRASPRRPDRSLSSRGSVRSRGDRSDDRDFHSRSRTRGEADKRTSDRLFGDDNDTRRSDLRDPHKSPGFGRDNDPYNDDRLETFGRKEDHHEPRSQYTPGFKDSKSRPGFTREENDDPNKRPPGTRSEYRGKPPPAGGDRDKYAKRDRGVKTTNVPSQGRRGTVDNPRRSHYGGSQRGGDRPVSTADSRLNDHIDRKLSKKGFKEPKFNESKKKREKEWMLDFKAHRPIPSKLNNTNENPKDTESYIIIINGVSGIPSENIPILKDKNVKAVVNYTITLYEEKEREFFGRTYSSRPIQTNPLVKETTNKEFVYIHTASASKDVCAIIECFLEIISSDEKVKTQYVSLGFARFDIFDEKTKIALNKLQMYLGSPRFLVTTPFASYLQTACTMNVEIKKAPDLDVLKPLVPSMTLCGMYDQIPGIIGNKMRAVGSKMQLCGYEDIVISNIEIESPPEFESKFDRFLKEFIYNKYKLDSDIDMNETLNRIGRPKITERRIWIDYDNTWKSSGNQTFISLNPPSRSGVYKAIGYAEVNNFIIDPKVSITFKMEFRLELPTDDKKKTEDTYFTIGWAYYLPNYKENGEIIEGVLD